MNGYVRPEATADDHDTPHRKASAMIHQNVELHNVAELQPAAGGGMRLQRVPETVRTRLNEGAQWRMLQPDNAEIRFVSNGPTTRVTLVSEGNTDVTLFYGMFDGRLRFTVTREPVTLDIPLPADPLKQLAPAYWKHHPFAPHVTRLILGGPRRDPLILLGVEGDNVRPPHRNEVPALRYLAYGTSITHGFDAEGPHLTYVGQTARRLGADLINLGVGGSAHCERELADYIAARDDWDVASLALSVNMQHFAMDEFSRRVAYMVHTVAGANPDRPVACITLYPYSRDFGIEPVNAQHGGTPEAYRQALRDAVAACPHPNAHLIEGPELLTDITGLTHDLIHPGDYGMTEMALHLAARLQALMEQSAPIGR